MDSSNSLEELSEFSQESAALDPGSPQDTVVALQYQPMILKGREGERLWKVVNERACVEFCRLQLRVSSPLVLFNANSGYRQFQIWIRDDKSV